MPILTRDQILSIQDDLKREIVSAPEWGGDVIVWVMTGTQRDRMESLIREKKVKDVRALITVLSVRNEDGSMMFSERDIPELTKRSSAVLDRIYEKAIELSKLKTEDIEIEEKNS
jgi:hypothetical protein